MSCLFSITVYHKDGYELLRDVIEVTRTTDGEKYRIKQVISTGMGEDIKCHYYDVRHTEIHIG